MDAAGPLRLCFALLPADPVSAEFAPSSAELRELFDIVHTTTTAIGIAEGEDFIDGLELSHADRLEAKKQLGQARNEGVLAYSSEVVDVRQGSFIVDVLIDPERLVEAVTLVVAWSARRGLDHAWEKVRGGQRLAGFASGMFARARETVEHAVTRRPARGGRRAVDVVEVSEAPEKQDDRRIDVTIVRVSAVSESDLRSVREILRELRLFDE